MDKAELEAAIDRLDRMSERCDRLIARDRPLQPDRSYGRKRLGPDYVARVAPVAHRQEPEVRYIPGKPPRQASRYVAPSEGEFGCGSIEQIFEGFEKAFDEMVQAHRCM